MKKKDKNERKRAKNKKMLPELCIFYNHAPFPLNSLKRFSFIASAIPTLFFCNLYLFIANVGRYFFFMLSDQCYSYQVYIFSFHRANFISFYFFCFCFCSPASSSIVIVNSFNAITHGSQYSCRRWWLNVFFFRFSCVSKFSWSTFFR